MGDVFLVVHEELGRELVAKLLHRRLAGDAQLLDRVRLEAQSLALLHETNVVQITDFRLSPDGIPFLVMEHLIGRTLKDELAARTLPLLEAISFAEQALSGLSAAHSLGIVHRDIKPENLFLSEELDGKITLKVIDFGIARIVPGVSDMGPQPLAVPTETGAVLGTPRYLSPEAALGKRGVDHRADLYALALVLYEMVAGRGPFEHLKHDFLTAHSVEDPLPPSRYAKRPIPAQLDAVILRGLHKNPDERYQSAKEFQVELERLRMLLSNSQGLETTVLSLAERSDLQSTGQLPGQAASAGDSTFEGQQRSSTAESKVQQTKTGFGVPRRFGTRPSVIFFASVLVGLITAIAVTGAVLALMGRLAR